MIRVSILLVLAALVLALPSVAAGCPLCGEAIANSQPDDEPASNLPAAINQSIYVMVTVPYLTLAVVGFLIYRGVKKNAEYLNSQQQAPPVAGPPQA